MWLATIIPAQRLVGQKQLLFHDEARNRQEEPFALATKGDVLASVASLGAGPSLLTWTALPEILGRFSVCPGFYRFGNGRQNDPGGKAWAGRRSFRLDRL
jgi:hypothetical protein